ncbi:hypothetical protein Droror1_Dr00006598 [Drosera rotundifolia]
MELSSLINILLSMRRNNLCGEVLSMRRNNNLIFISTNSASGGISFQYFFLPLKITMPKDQNDEVQVMHLETANIELKCVAWYVKTGIRLNTSPLYNVEPRRFCTI